MKKIGIIIALVLMLVGCTTQQTSNESISISHKLGNTLVKTNPEKVIIFDMGLLDIYDSFDLKVGGVAKDSLPNQLKKFDTDEIINAGTLFEPNFESIAAYAPDLIIISGRTSKHYDELSKIAPTVYLGRDSSDEGYLASIKSNVDILKAIYTKHKFSDIVSELEVKLNELKNKVNAANYTTLFAMANGDEVKAFGPKSRYDVVFNEFGFKTVDANFDTSTHGATVTFEFINSLQPDVMIVMDRAQVTGGATLAKELLNNDFVTNTPAYKENRIIYVDPSNWYLTEGGIHAFESMIDECMTIFQG